MIKRFFYPIGQGAFYAEKHPTFNIVYDCGNLKNTTYGDNVIKQAFKKNDVIDILFISHLDYDHVSKVGKLKDHCKIKNVVLPLLYEKDINLLVNINRALNNDIIDLIKSPESFFDSDTNIWKIKPVEGSVEYNRNKEPIVLNESDSLNKEVDYGKKFMINKDDNWCFIPYNLKYDERRKDLIDKLQTAGFDVDKLQDDVSYISNEILKQKRRKTKTEITLKQIYEDVEGDLNQNSLILYSGPIDQNINCKNTQPSYDTYVFYNCMDQFYMQSSKAGCIYTGDADLNKTPLKSYFYPFWDNIGTIQIPHHGSRKSFNIKEIKAGVFCPISVGCNSFGHPSHDVVAEIISNDCIPILVTENVANTFIEIIHRNKKTMKDIYWHLQMFLPGGRENESIDSKKMLEEAKPIIGTGEWDNLQCKYFKSSNNGGMRIDDIVLVREGSKPLAICEVISDCFQDQRLTDKYVNKNYRYVKILEFYNDIKPFPQARGTLQRLTTKDTDSWRFINDWYKQILNNMETT